jgi:hypothetical protein
MAKAAGRLTFALKAAQPFRVASHFGRQHFNGYAIAEQNVPRAINGAHSTLAEEGLDLILTVKHLARQRRWIFFQDLAVSRAEADTVIEFLVAG